MASLAGHSGAHLQFCLLGSLLGSSFPCLSKICENLGLDYLLKIIFTANPGKVEMHVLQCRRHSCVQTGRIWKYLSLGQTVGHYTRIPLWDGELLKLELLWDDKSCIYLGHFPLSPWHLGTRRTNINMKSCCLMQPQDRPWGQNYPAKLGPDSWPQKQRHNKYLLLKQLSFSITCKKQ